MKQIHNFNKNTMQVIIIFTIQNVNSSPASTVNESTLEQIQGEEENTAAHDKQAKFLHEQISNYPSEYKNEVKYF